jgi:hypothetical protein
VDISGQGINGSGNRKVRALIHDELGLEDLELSGNMMLP